MGDGYCKSCEKLADKLAVLRAIVPNAERDVEEMAAILGEQHIEVKQARAAFTKAVVV